MGNKPSANSHATWVVELQTHLRRVQSIMSSKCTEVDCAFTMYNTRFVTLPSRYGDAASDNRVVHVAHDGAMTLPAKEYLRLVLAHQPQGETDFGEWSEYAQHILCHMYKYHCEELFKVLGEYEFAVWRTQLRNFHTFLHQHRYRASNDMLHILDWIDAAEFRPPNYFASERVT